LSVAGIEEVTKSPISNAYRLAARFRDLGILDETTGQRRNRAFVYREYLELFEDEK